MFSSDIDIDRRSTTHKGLTITFVCSFVLLLGLCITSGISLLPSVATFPKGLPYFLYFIHLFVFSVVGVFITLLNKARTYAKRLHLFISAWNFVMVPHLALFSLQFFSYSVHSKDFIITFFPRVNAALVMAVIFGVFETVTLVIQERCYWKIYSSSFMKESMILASMFAGCYFSITEIIALFPKFRHSAFESPLLVFYNDIDTKRNGFMHYFVIVVGVLVLLTLLTCAVLSCALWRAREKERAKKWTDDDSVDGMDGIESVGDTLGFEVPASDGAMSDGVPDMRAEAEESGENAEGKVPSDGLSSLSSASSQQVKKKRKIPMPDALVRSGFAASTRQTKNKKHPMVRRSMVLSVFVMISAGIMAILLLLLLLTMMNSNAAYKPVMRELGTKAKSTYVNNSSNTTKVYGVLYVLYHVLAYIAILLTILLSTSTLNNSIRATFDPDAKTAHIRIGEGVGSSQ